MSQPQQNVSHLDWARSVINGNITGITADDVLARAKALQRDNRFDLAREVLTLANIQPIDPSYRKVQQQIAVSTYKDEDIPRPHRFYAALDVLRETCELDTTNDCETLGIAGAIEKRLWEYSGQREALERSLAWYYKAYREKPADEGYVGINTAFILDLLASQEMASVDRVPPEVPAQRFATADAIREEILAAFEPAARQNPTWWACATIAEAALGLAKFELAVEFLLLGTKANPPRWERDSTVRQLAMLTRIESGRRGDAYRAGAEDALMRGLGVTPQTIKSILLGKVGLALSGGGFRASLFHIGVLAKLAELDVLRHIEVISCVSGGSIIGAHYYLELKKELERKPALTQVDYINVVQRVERDFLAGVQSNIRTRVASSIPASLKMALWPGYTRTSRAGELYEKKLFSKVEKKAKRPLPSLLINPPGTQGFNPRYDNWDRDSKVPMLVLNATTINTGHNWQFTATWMGESPQAINGAIDTIPRLRRMYIDGRNDVPKTLRDLPVGQAVGASAAVPGVFEPIVLRNAYPDRAIRLADGGVHDNQGLASLFEESCNVLLVSDASGQMEEVKNASGAILPVAARTNTILQARVREAQFDQLQTLQRSGAIDGAMFIHLTKDLEAEAISFKGAKDDAEMRRHVDPTTNYRVDRVVQKQLAEIRTDLDSFSDAEAYGLMMSAYLMTERALVEEKCAPTLPLDEQPASWRFLRVHKALTVPGSDDNARMRSLLAASKQLAGKVWRQVVALQLIAGALGLAGLTWLFVNRSAIAAFVKALAPTRIPSPTYAELAGGAATLAVVLAFRYAADKFLRLQKRLGEVLLGMTFATVGFFAAWLHLAIFDQIFLWYGRWDEPKGDVQTAIAAAGSPRLTIAKTPTPAAPPVRAWTPVMRRILNLFG